MLVYREKNYVEVSNRMATVSVGGVLAVPGQTKIAKSLSVRAQRIGHQVLKACYCEKNSQRRLDSDYTRKSVYTLRMTLFF